MATKKTPAAPRAKLAPLKVMTVEKALKKGDIPTLLVEGDYPTRYNEASAVRKEADELMAELKPVMLPEALTEIFEHNTNRPWDTVSSVKLRDESGEVTRVTFMAKYSPTDSESAEALFAEIKMKNGQKPNINDYLGRTIHATFDSTVFLGPDGRFDKNRYEEIMLAVGVACQGLGIKNPLATTEVTLPLPDFHTRRWMDFDEATNRKITQVIPNQINFTPCPAAPADASKA